MCWLFIAILVRTAIIDGTGNNRLLYAMFGIVYALWFISLPIVVLAMSYTPAWKRQKVVVAVQLGIKLVAYVFLAFMFRPMKSNR